MNLIPYYDVNDQLCFFNCANVVAVMSDKMAQPPDENGNPVIEEGKEYMTKVLIDYRGGYILTFESTTSISKRIFEALELPDMETIELEDNHAGS